jgi:hypothetical protein
MLCDQKGLIMVHGRFAPEAANRNRMLWMSAFHPDSDIAHLRSHVGYLPILLQKSAATDGSFWPFR